MALTEADWLAGKGSLAKLCQALPKPTSPRKLRLFAAAACRLGDRLRDSPLHRSAVDAVERSADGLLSEEEFVAARSHYYLRQYQEDAGVPDALSAAVTASLVSGALDGAEVALGCVVDHFACGATARREHHARNAGRRAVWRLAHELFGNPFRPFTLLPPWQGGGFEQPDGVVVRPTSDVTGLAAAIHLTGDFTRLPILADALEEAGATDATLLAHCRGPGPHARGCWAHDLARGVR